MSRPIRRSPPAAARLRDNRWLILGVLFLARTVMGYQFQSVASVAPFLVEDLGIDYAGVGALIGLYMLPGIVVALPGGLLGARFGDKRMVLVGFALMAAGGLLIGAGATQGTAVAGRLVMGVGAVLFNVLLTKMVTDWFAGREIVTAMALFVSSWPLGVALGLATQGWIAAEFSWPAVFFVTAAACAVCFGVMAVLYRPPPAGRGGAAAAPTPVRPSRREVLLVSLAALVWSTYNASYAIVFSFASGPLIAAGVPIAWAGVMVSTVTWLSILSVPLGGFLAERWGRPNLFMAVCMLSTATVIAAAPLAAGGWAMLVHVGLVGGAPAGVVMALASEALRPAGRSLGMGVFFTWFYVGMAALPPVAGWARDAAGEPDAPLLVGAVLMLAALGFLGLFRAAQSHRPPAPNGA